MPNNENSTVWIKEDEEQNSLSVLFDGYVFVAQCTYTEGGILSVGYRASLPRIFLTTDTINKIYDVLEANWRKLWGSDNHLNRLLELAALAETTYRENVVQQEEASVEEYLDWIYAETKWETAAEWTNRFTADTKKLVPNRYRI